MITVTTPDNRNAERHYALSVLLTEFLGLTFEFQHHAELNIKIQLTSDPSGKTITLSDHFFQKANDNWLNHESLPHQPLQHWTAHADLPETTLVDSQLPIIYGEQQKTGAWFTHDDQGINLGLDIIGSAFFMLTRYEEIIKPDRDQHDRFPATASIAYKEGFLERPIINEYLEILWTCMKRIWPSVFRAERKPQILVSHDVDWPLTRNSGLISTLKHAGRDLTQRRSLGTALKRLRNFQSKKHANFDHDPHNTFAMIMDLSEANDLRSAFYFITDHTGGSIDGEYRLDDPWIQQLIRRIHERGHEIGLHPSYNTYNDLMQVKREFGYLLETIDKLGFTQPRWGGRQHFLRWQAPTTWQVWDDAGLDYDSTVGYADRAGFRAGTCYEYPVFNVRTRRPLKLRERPLIVMEGTLFGQRYMGLNYEEALAYTLELKRRCFMFDGQFTLLWHNSHFLSPGDVEVYRQLLSTTEN